MSTSGQPRRPQRVHITASTISPAVASPPARNQTLRHTVISRSAPWPLVACSLPCRPAPWASARLNRGASSPAPGPWPSAPGAPPAPGAPACCPARRGNKKATNLHHPFAWIIDRLPSQPLGAMTEEQLKQKVREGYILESPAEMTEGYRKALVVQLLVQGDTE